MLQNLLKSSYTYLSFYFHKNRIHIMISYDIPSNDVSFRTYTYNIQTSKKNRKLIQELIYRYYDYDLSFINEHITINLENKYFVINNLEDNRQIVYKEL